MLGWRFFFQAEDGIRDGRVTGVQTCALPISPPWPLGAVWQADAVLAEELLGPAGLSFQLGDLGLQLGEPVAAVRPPAATRATAKPALGLRPVGVAADAPEQLLGAHAVDPGERLEGVVLGVGQDPWSADVAAEAAVLQRDEVLHADPGPAGDMDLGVAQLKAPLREPGSEVVPAEHLLGRGLLLLAHHQTVLARSTTDVCGDQQRVCHESARVDHARTVARLEAGQGSACSLDLRWPDHAGEDRK